MSEHDRFKIWQNLQPTTRGMLRRKGASIKVGQQTCKTAQIAEYGNTDTGKVSKRELTLTTAERYPDSGEFDFGHPKGKWSCQNEELDKLVTFLNDETGVAGRYRLIASDSPAAAIADLLDSGDLDIGALAVALTNKNAIESLLKAIVSNTAGETAVAAAVQAQRRHLIGELSRLAETPDATETQMQNLIGNAYWLFGGRYVGIARRDLAKLDQHDIPLIGANGTLHLVELKGPVIPRLVRQHRNHWIVGNEVHEAVSQTMNYLRSLDEEGLMLQSLYRNERGESWDLRRVHATVVIGHAHHVSDATASPQIVEQTIRSYNAHLSRIEVVTYESLFDAADRALQFTPPPPPPPPHGAP